MPRLPKSTWYAPKAGPLCMSAASHFSARRVVHAPSCRSAAELKRLRSQGASRGSRSRPETRGDFRPTTRRRTETGGVCTRPAHDGRHFSVTNLNPADEKFTAIRYRGTVRRRAASNETPACPTAATTSCPAGSWGGKIWLFVGGTLRSATRHAACSSVETAPRCRHSR